MLKVPLKPTTIDAYIAGCTPEAQKILKHIRQIVHQEQPDAVESISYQMPAFKLHNKPLIYFAAFTHHIGVYPTPGPIEELSDELKQYQTGKGTLQFPLDQPIPYDVIKKLITYRATKINTK
ncbi:DUF1801 domain-containing protein [candidate division WWE3 bacterium]|nr:DUF1801 domain-containing protein [candidate division WWE3 bacterium]